VGCGYWGRNLVRNFSERGALAPICDRDQEAAEALVARYGSRQSHNFSLAHER
jgi:UDP-2-acetamido-3-amino-2,3-dideoxy-glucuronate N-acetyltransferase